MQNLADRGGFTLLELLAVITIIVLVSVVALPTVLPALAHRQVSEAGRVLQGALAGARDKAIHDGQPSGIRLLPDPVFFRGTAVVGTTKDKDGNPIPITVPAPLRLANGMIDPTEVLAYNRAVPIGPAPEYAEGMVTVRRDYSPLKIGPRVFRAITDPSGAGTYQWPTLILEEAAFDLRGAPNPPTSWSWNVRVGDKVQINGAGPWYTVVGPMWAGPAAGNAEMFVNVGVPGSVSPLNPTGNRPIDYLLLANGRDDNHNGWIDEGWDGIDQDANPQSPGYGIVDDVGEWEAESWHGAAAQGLTSVPYTIRRRPMPGPNAREVALPSQMVVDASTWATTRERSRLPVDRFTGVVDILVNPDGSVSYTSPYGTPSSFGMADTFYHFFLAERQDVATPVGNAAPLLPVPEPAGRNARRYAGPTIKGQWALLTLFARTGQIASVESPPFDDPTAATKAKPYDPNRPFTASQQGSR